MSEPNLTRFDKVQFRPSKDCYESLKENKNSLPINIKNDELEYVDKDIYNISFSGESFDDSVIDLNSLKMKGEAHNHYFFTTGVTTSFKNNEVYDPIYTLQSNLLSVYSKSSSMIFNEPLI